MRKKILLMLMLGVGFTPALFAKDSVRSGELLVSKTSPSGIGCNLPLDKSLETTHVGKSSGTVETGNSKIAK